MAIHERETKKTDSTTKSHSEYSIGDVLSITNELFKLSKEKKYPPGAFVHALVFALEFAQKTYGIPPQQLAQIKRDCRHTVQEIVTTKAKTPAPPSKT